MNILQGLLQTDSGVVGLILRITLTVVMFPHGAQKVLGWFGGHGFKATMKSFTNSGIPALLALPAIAAEFFGPLGPRFRISDPHCSLRYSVRDAGCYCCSSLVPWLLYELVR
jgi:hypothetical protein